MHSTDWGVGSSQILPQVRETRDTALDGPPAPIQYLELAFGDPDRVAMATWRMQEIIQNISLFCQYYADVQVTAANQDWNPLALRNPLLMRQAKTLKDHFTYCIAPDGHPASVTVCQKQDNLTRQRRAEMAAHSKGGVGIASSPEPPAPPKDPAETVARSVAGYTSLVLMDLNSGKRRVSVAEKAKRFVDGRCSHCGGFNHRAAECVASKKGKTFKVAGADVLEVGTRTGSKESGEDHVNWRRMPLQLTIKVFFQMLYNVLEFCVYKLGRWRHWKDQWKGNI